MIHLHSGWIIVILTVATFPLIYYLLACVAAWRFSHEDVKHTADFAPPVSILKPLHGVDFASYENYASFCTQDYPDYEILFAVGDPADAAVPMVQRIITDFPARQIRLLIGAEVFGANRKVNSLARLAR